MAKDDHSDPFAPRDATILRPRPGGGRRTGFEATSAPESRVVSSRSVASAPPLASRDFIAAGLSPLLQAASPLLILAGRLRSTGNHLDTTALRRQVLDEIRQFEDRARLGAVPPEAVVAARYVLCATLDEAVLSTPWGSQGEWAGHPLLVALHNETWGGEKFFEMLNRISADPARHIDLMELQYICLAMGFSGKYQVQDRGQSQLADVYSDLGRKIAAVRGRPVEELSEHWQGVIDQRNPVLRYVPWWVIGAVVLLVLTVAFTYYHSRLSAQAAPVQARLAAIGLVPSTAAVIAQPNAVGVRLHTLLAEDELKGILTIDEQGPQTVVTLVAPDLFASGSARVNPAYYGSLRNVALALNQVPGRVQVIGHTDDQPLRSLKYQDNFELSRERAVGVADILKLAIDNTGRMQASGVGSSQPRYKPESLPENRARNRRVEIVHVSND